MVGDFQVKSCYVSKVQPFNNWMLIKMAGSLGVFVRDADSSIYFVPVWYHFDWVVAVAFSVGDLLSEWKNRILNHWSFFAYLSHVTNSFL